eukprot:3935083-Lingulodinium_polyedra.AAC.1
MVFHEPPPADLAQYTCRLCATEDVPTIAGPPRYFYLISDGINRWLWCRICGKNDDGSHGHL